jgi:hypothetical protein
MERVAALEATAEATGARTASLEATARQADERARAAEAAAQQAEQRTAAGFNELQRYRDRAGVALEEKDTDLASMREQLRLLTGRVAEAEAVQRASRAEVTEAQRSASEAREAAERARLAAAEAEQARKREEAERKAAEYQEYQDSFDYFQPGGAGQGKMGQPFQGVTREMLLNAGKATSPALAADEQLKQAVADAGKYSTDASRVMLERVIAEARAAGVREKMPNMKKAVALLATLERADEAAQELGNVSPEQADPLAGMMSAIFDDGYALPEEDGVEFPILDDYKE